MSFYSENRVYKRPQEHGLIIIGYQGIGKSSFASSRNKTIDLESSNFRVDDNWYIVYCQIAMSLAKQGYIVFTSSHQVVVEEFMKYENPVNNYTIAIVAPAYNLKHEWVEKLYQRWCSDVNNEKNRRAYIDADDNFYKEIKWLASQTTFPYIPIKNMDYIFSNIIDGLCRIYGANRCYRSAISPRRDYDEDED